MAENNRLHSERIPKLLLSLAAPAICAQIVTLMYNLVDRIYLGRMADGTLAMAAIGICAPIVTVVTAFTGLLGRGGAPLAAIRMGEGDRESAERYLGNSFSALILSSLAITALVLAFQEPLLRLFGASENTLPYAMEYMTAYICGTAFVQLTVGMNYYICLLYTSDLPARVFQNEPLLLCRAHGGREQAVDPFRRAARQIRRLQPHDKAMNDPRRQFRQRIPAQRRQDVPLELPEVHLIGGGLDAPQQFALHPRPHPLRHRDPPRARRMAGLALLLRLLFQQQSPRFRKLAGVDVAEARLSFRSLSDHIAAFIPPVLAPVNVLPASRHRRSLAFTHFILTALLTA